MGVTRLLGFSLGAVVAISVGVQGAVGAPAAMHVKITGKDWARQLAPGADERRGNAVVTRRARWGGKAKTTDSRVSGTYRNAFDIWGYPDSRMHFADIKIVLKNPRGAWKGSGFGIREADGSHYIFATSVGSGAHAGLRYRLFVHDKASGSAEAHTFDVDGWIERATAPTPQPVVAGDVHVKVVGRSNNAAGSAGVRIGSETTSDPRTTGGYTGTVRMWKFPDGRLHLSGEFALRSSLGTWTGTRYAIVTSDGRYIEFVDLLGQEGLSGLRYRRVGNGRWPGAATASFTLTVSGWIESVK